MTAIGGLDGVRNGCLLPPTGLSWAHPVSQRVTFTLELVNVNGNEWVFRHGWGR